MSQVELSALPVPLAIPSPRLAGAATSSSNSSDETTDGSGSGAEPAVHRNNLPLINGVIVPVLLNVMGVILFLRLT